LVRTYSCRVGPNFNVESGLAHFHICTKEMVKKLKLSVTNRNLLSSNLKEFQHLTFPYIEFSTHTPQKKDDNFFTIFSLHLRSCVKIAVARFYDSIRKQSKSKHLTLIEHFALSKAALRHAFSAYIYCMRLHFQINYFGLSQTT